MAKKKKGDKSTTGPKLPKEVAGVKLSKEVRRKGEALIARAASPEGRAALAKGLTVAATLANLAVERGKAAAGDAKPPAQSPRTAAAPAHDTAQPSGGTAPIDPAKVAEAVSTVADAVLGRLFGGKRA